MTNRVSVPALAPYWQLFLLMALDLWTDRPDSMLSMAYYAV